MGEDLSRFVVAQEGMYDRALQELRDGRKRSHWIWFVFPQIAGLGLSATSQRFAITSLAGARSYLAHPVLGPRLHECAAMMLTHAGRTADDVLGGIDAVKLRSSMTLFHRAEPAEVVFAQVLDTFFDGEPDPATDERL